MKYKKRNRNSFLENLFEFIFEFIFEFLFKAIWNVIMFVPRMIFRFISRLIEDIWWKNESTGKLVHYRGLRPALFVKAAKGAAFL